MIDYISIQNTLNRLDAEYNKPGTDILLSILYSKLAVLELCGWIEVSIDNLLIDYVDKTILKEENKKQIKEIIGKNYGFKYKENLFPLFCSVLGINNVENIIDVIPDANLVQLKALLGNYSKERNDAAHTDTLAGTTRSYTAPSSVLHDYNLIKPAFQLIETQIQAL